MFFPTVLIPCASFVFLTRVETSLYCSLNHFQQYWDWQVEFSAISQLHGLQIECFRGWWKGDKKVASATSFLITSSSNTLNLLMPGTLAENTFITMALATGSNYFAVVFLLYSETPEFISRLSSASLPTKEAEKNLNVNLLWLYSDFFLSAKMNS